MKLNTLHTPEIVQLSSDELKDLLGIRKLALLDANILG
jgi:hypothetical protein